MNRNEADSICEMLDYTRKLTKWYISKVPSELLTKSLTIEGHEMNSAYWLIAHLTWAQYSISRSIGASHDRQDWIAEFKISSPHTGHQDHWPVWRSS